MACLGDDTIAAYVDGALDLGQVRRVDEHIDGCVTCRGQLSAVAAVPELRSFVEPAPRSGDTPSRSPTLPSSRSREPEAGEMLGRYMVEQVIGRGGMGVVVRAHDPELDRAVAIKLVDPATPSGAWRARLRAEARAMARLRHPNVVTVYDVGTVGDQVFVAMELIDGTSFATWLAGGRRTRDALLHCIAAGRGLAAAHAAGLVHGDVKPDNILIDRDGRALIGDFGLARDDRATVRGLAGTPAYLAPELLRREPPDHRSDQFAFAITVHEALAGKRPWPGVPLDRPGPARPRGMPAAVWRVVARGLAVDPAARFPSLAAFVDALDRGAARRRRAGLALASGAIVAAGAIGVAAFAGGRAEPMCADPVAQVTPLASAVDPHALCGPVPSAPCAALATALGHRLADWRTTHVSVCEATRDGSQSAALLDHRMRCLDHRLLEHDALIGQLAKPLAARDVADALAAITRLRGPESCATLDPSARTPPPPPDRAAAIARADRWVAAAAADYALGRYPAGLDALAPHLDEIAKLEHPPLLATAGRVLGQLQREAGQLAAAEKSFDLGLRAAAESGDDAASAGLLLDLAYLIGESRAEPQRGRELLRAAEAAVVRAGKPPELEAVLLLDRGVIDEQLGEFADAATVYARALELRKTSRAAPGDIAVALQRLCSAEGQLGKLDDAQAHCQQAVDGLERALGADHPLTAAARSDLAIAYAMHGNLGAARERWDAARASLERSLGPTAPELAPVLLNLSDVSRMLGEPAAAERYLTRAVAVAGTAELSASSLGIRIRVARQLRAAGKTGEALAMLDDIERRAEARFGLDHPVTADALAELAKSYYESDRFADARTTFTRAIAAYRKLYGERHAATLTLEGQYGQTLMALHDLSAARPVFERVMLGLEATVPETSPFRAQAYSNFADCLLALGETARAADLAEKGFAIREALADDPVQVAESRFVLGRALWRANRDRPRAVALVTKARDEMRAIGAAATSLPAAERWLASETRR